MGAVQAEEGQPRQQVAAVAAPAARPKETRACYKCGKAGHLARQCTAAAAPAPARQTQQPRGQGGGPQKKTILRCFACNEVGHRKQECPRVDYIYCKSCREPGHVAACCRQPVAKVGSVAAPAGSPAPQSRD